MWRHKCERSPLCLICFWISFWVFILKRYRGRSEKYSNTTALTIETISTHAELLNTVQKNYFLLFLIHNYTMNQWLLRIWQTYFHPMISMSEHLCCHTIKGRNSMPNNVTYRRQAHALFNATSRPPANCFWLYSIFGLLNLVHKLRGETRSRTGHPFTTPSLPSPRRHLCSNLRLLTIHPPRCPPWSSLILECR